MTKSSPSILFVALAFVLGLAGVGFGQTAQLGSPIGSQHLYGIGEK